MVVCDMDRFEVHTNFTGTVKQKHAFDLAGLADPANLDILRRVFTDPNSLKPGITSESITVEAAERFAKLADGMRDKGIEPLRAAHFLMKLMFCMFGEDTGLLPSGLFGKLLDTAKANPAMLIRRLENLFAAMSQGGDFGAETILWFNGGLFADTDVIPLTTEEINNLANINTYDWASVEPSIFGTLFQRTLDPSTRTQIGAQYTSRQDIETLLVPVLLVPLRREWEEVKRRCEEELWPKVVKASRSRSGKASAKDSPQRKAFDRAILDFIERLAHVAVLDPACGSGNFLYVAIHMLLDLEKEVIAYAATRGLSLVPQVNPAQLHGLEINPYAQQLAQVVIWIGYLQWMHHNGFKMPDHPVLAPIDSIRKWTPSSTFPTQSIRRSRSGRRQSLLSGIRRSWATRRCELAWVMTMLRHCFASIRNACRINRTYAATGLRRLAVTSGRKDPRRGSSCNPGNSRGC